MQNLNLPSRPRRSKPEVLAPAGNLRSLKAALDYGADAVYCGGKEFGMRSAAKNFSFEDFAQAADYAHRLGSRVYVTCNILPRNDEIPQLRSYLSEISQTGIDALIVSDMGVLLAAKELAPDLEIHISTQAGVTNYQAANALHQLGASRVVLARELSLADIAQVRANVPEELEIECFVHGSMCMAFSGRCLISNHMTGRDANHGDCAQSCRWKYHVVEEKRPGQFIPVELTDQGTFLFNSQDMNLLEHVDKLLDAGITSLKIEGRAKSAYYAAAMANAYGVAVDNYLVQRGYEDEDGNILKPFTSRVIPPKPDQKPVEQPAWLLEEPFKVTHREYCTGFYFPDTPAGQATERGGYINDWKLIGEIVDYHPQEKRLTLFSRNKIVPGQLMEIFIPRQAPISFELPAEGVFDEKGEEVQMINRPAKKYSVPCPFPVPVGAMVRTPARPLPPKNHS